MASTKTALSGPKRFSNNFCEEQPRSRSPSPHPQNTPHYPQPKVSAPQGLPPKAPYLALPFSSQSLPASSQPPKAPISLAQRHKSHPALLHISVVDPTRGIPHKSQHSSNTENLLLNNELLNKLINNLTSEEMHNRSKENDPREMLPPVAPPRKKNRKRRTTLDEVANTI